MVPMEDWVPLALGPLGAVAVVSSTGEVVEVAGTREVSAPVPPVPPALL